MQGRIFNAFDFQGGFENALGNNRSKNVMKTKQ